MNDKNDHSEILMSKEELLEFKGRVLELLPNANFIIELEENGQKLIAYTSGKMRKNRIRVLANDLVIVEMTPYDLTRGRVIHRFSSAAAAAAHASSSQGD